MTDEQERRKRVEARKRALDAAAATPAQLERRTWLPGSAIYVPEVDPQ